MTSLRFTVSVLLAISAYAQPPAGMVFVPGGEFAMGRSHSLPDDNQKWWPDLLSDDRPVHTVTVDAFYIDIYEVTIADYAAFVKATKRKPPYNWAEGKPPQNKLKFPVAGVSWFDADAYCRWSKKRLPAEAEWERAARGLKEKIKHPWGDRNSTKKDARYDSVDGPVEVGKYPPNAIGLFDIAGNVWEWCADWFEREYYSHSPTTNPTGPEKGMYKVLRGGSWADPAKYMTVAHRSWARPAEQSPNVGFRCVAPVKR